MRAAAAHTEADPDASVVGSMSAMCSAFRSFGAPDWIYDTLRHGVGWNWRLPRRVKQRHRQRKLQPAEEEFVDKEVARLLQTGAIETGRAVVLCPIKTVPKDGGRTFRLIHDLRAVNRHFTPPTFSLSGLRDLDTLLLPGARMLVQDLRSAFHQISVAPRLRPYLAFEWRGTTYRWTTMPFGFNCSPFVMQSVANVLAAALTRAGFPTTLYMDDALISVPADYPHDPMPAVRRVFAQFGAILAHDKGVAVPSTTVPYLGFEVTNTDTHGYISVPRRKAATIRQTLRRILSEQRVSRHRLASVIGSIAALRSACPASSGLLRAGYKALGAAATRHTEVPLTARIRNEAEWWLDALTRPMHAFFRTGPPTLTVSTDASLLGWGVTVNPGAELDTKSMHTYQGRWRRGQAERLSMGALELLAVQFSLSRLPPGQPTAPTVVRLYSDSRNALAALKRGSAAKTSYAIARSTLRMLHRRHILLRAEWISTNDNTTADRLSRFLPVLTC